MLKHVVLRCRHALTFFLSHLPKSLWHDCLALCPPFAEALDGFKPNTAIVGIAHRVAGKSIRAGGVSSERLPATDVFSFVRIWNQHPSTSCARS